MADQRQNGFFAKGFQTSSGAGASDMRKTRRLIAFAIVALVVVACFAKPLCDLVRHCLESDLYSHLVLVPFVCGYTVWLRRSQARLEIMAPSFIGCAISFVLGVVCLGGYWLAVRSGWKLHLHDYLALTIYAMLLFLLAAAFLFVGVRGLRPFAFSIGLLFLMAPFPEVVLNAVISFCSMVLLISRLDA
jgi:hypothetical protein